MKFKLNYFKTNKFCFQVRVLKEDNSEAKPSELGRIVIKLPLPPGTIQGLWENDELFMNTYFHEFPGFYDTADVGTIDSKKFVY
jgi:propionyl-CoA synthetase